MLQLTDQDLQDFYLGVLFYCSGGGGSEKLAASWIDQIRATGNMPQLADLSEIDDDEGVVAILVMANPTEATSLPGSLAVAAFDAMVQAIRPMRTFKYVMAAEIGPAVAPVPLYLSAQLAKYGITAVDGDGSGRVLASAQASMFGQVPCSPTILIGQDGLTYSCTGNINGAKFEEILWSVLGPPFNSLAGVGLWPIDGRTLKYHALPNTLSRCIQMGRVIRAGGPGLLTNVANFSNGKVIFEGDFTKYVSIPQQAAENIGAITLTSGNLTMTLFNQGENLVAWRSDQVAPVALLPDIITMFDLSTGKPFTTWQMDVPKTGTPVGVIAAPAEQALVQNPNSQAVFKQTLAGIGYAGPAVSGSSLIASVS